MGDWADLMEAFGGRLPRDIAEAQMVPGYYSKPKAKRKKPAAAKIADSKPVRRTPSTKEQA